MKFFKPEDFEGRHHVDAGVSGYVIGDGTAKVCADLANAKLEREGKVVYSTTNDPWWKPFGFNNQPDNKALLIAIEPIEVCSHPAERIFQQNYAVTGGEGFQPGLNVTRAAYLCACGARVKPAKFEVCE